MSVIQKLQDGLELAIQESGKGLRLSLLAGGTFCLTAANAVGELEAQFHLPSAQIAATFPLLEPHVRISLTRQNLAHCRLPMSQILLRAIDEVLELLAFNNRLAALRSMATSMISSEQDYLAESVSDYVPSVGPCPTDRSLYQPGSNRSYVHFLWSEQNVPQRVLELSRPLFNDFSETELSEVLAEQLILSMWDWETEQTWQNNRHLPFESGLIAA